MLHLAELQWSGKENDRLPDNRSEEAVKTAEKPNTLRKTREEITSVIWASSVIYIKSDSTVAMLP